VLLLPDAPGAPDPPFMLGQLCVGFGVAGAEGVALAVLADPALTAVVADVDVDVVDAEVAGCVVAALATAMLAPKPTPSAPAPTAVPMMILPSLVFNVSAS
jgi:hypothetical protein